MTFNEQQKRELMKNLSESQFHPRLNGERPRAMMKTKLEKIVYSFHHPRNVSGGRGRNR